MSQDLGRLLLMATDREVLEQLAPLTDRSWNALFESVEVWRHNPTPFTWKGREPSYRGFAWVEFDNAFNSTFSLMFRVGLLINNHEWRPLNLARTWEEQVAHIERYTLVCCARYLTHLARKDRTCEGLVANSLEDGRLLMTLDRARSFVSPEWKRSEF
jgi:hypothetical protein